MRRKKKEGVGTELERETLYEIRISRNVESAFPELIMEMVDSLSRYFNISVTISMFLTVSVSPSYFATSSLALSASMTLSQSRLPIL